MLFVTINLPAVTFSQTMFRFFGGFTASSDQIKTGIFPMSDAAFSDARHYFELKTFLLTKRDIKSQFVLLAPSKLMNII